MSIPRLSARLSLKADGAATVTLAAPPRAMSWARIRPVGPAEDQGRSSRPRIERLHAVRGARRGLGEHRRVGIDAVHGEDQVGGNDDILSERPRPVRAESLEVGAQKGSPGPAVLAMPAVHVGIDRDVFADAESLGAVAQRVHRSDQLMAGGKRELGEEFAVVDVQIRAADSGLPYPYPYFPWPRIGCRHLPDRETARGVVDNGFHRESRAETPPFRTGSKPLNRVTYDRRRACGGSAGSPPVQ